MQAFKRSATLLLKALLPIAASAIFLITLYAYYRSITHFWRNGFLLLAVLYGILFIIFLHMYGGTKLDTEKKRNLILSCAIALLFTNLLIYIVISLIALRFFNPLALVLSMLLQFGVCSILYFVLVGLVRLMYPPQKAVAVISASERDADTVKRIKMRDTKHKIEAEVTVGSVVENIDILEPYPTVILGETDKEARAKILTYCYIHGKEIVIIPSMQDILLNNSTQYIVDDKLLYMDKYVGFSAEAAFIKRAFDIVLSLIGIIITSPIMAVVALLIHGYDKGPALFKQKRLTRNGKEFTIVKFRSMIQNAESSGGTFLVLDDDERITPIGKFIRATRIDELPQLFNILKGDMSFVGPRPERPELYDIYCKACPEFSYRLKVKAGLTGYAQVYGKYNTPAEDKVKLDLLYIEKASVIQDLQLLLYTVKIIFVKDSTEGIKDIDKAAKK